MHAVFFTIALAVTIARVGAQVIFNTTTSEFVCPLGKAAFCAGTSLETNIIIRCNGTFGQPGNCDDNLAGVPPIGVKFATCYECSPTAGNAACSFNNIVYPDSGAPFSVADGNAHCNSTNTTLSSVAPLNSANISSTLSYSTSSASAAPYSAASFHVGNAPYSAAATPLTTTVTSYSTSEVSDFGPKSVTIAPGSGGRNASAAATNVASATATSTASSSAVEPFAGVAPKEGASYALTGAFALVIAVTIL
ncbi:MAG: hypothetical protein HETSPECPRED_000231 [Heterodermia speciosa]|uniref:Uncharacterized protein n=1 Tax=Heterodermia speciosa TaxID=116794 RepID=A0A8H3EEU5_9LECA|nr:MAG: hypothetical protein HETSPECPRED_000231 [Heterodermia speciosa]